MNNGFPAGGRFPVTPQTDPQSFLLSAWPQYLDDPHQASQLQQNVGAPCPPGLRAGERKWLPPFCTGLTRRGQAHLR